MSHADLFSKGYGPVMLPVIPPGATIAPGSTVTDAGKTPGKLTPNGWVGVNLKHTDCPNAAVADMRDRWGASVGFVCGRHGLVALDIDIQDHDTVEKVRDFAAQFGIEYYRREVADPNHHKEVLFFRVVEDVTGEPIEIASRDIRFERAAQKELIQIIGAGKQFVVDGTHVGTGTPYVVTPADHSFDDMPAVTLPMFDAFVAGIIAELPNWGCTPLSAVNGSLAKTKAQRYEGQTATEKELQEWLALVPNTLQAYPTRDEWVQVMYAIYGASEGQPWGRDVWLQWCTAVDQTPGLPEAYWDRVKPEEVRSGMGFIRREARRNAPGRAAMLDFKYAPDIDPQVLAAVAQNNGPLWPIVRKRYAYLASQHRFIDLFTGEDISVPAVNTIMLSQLTQLKAQMPAGLLFPRTAPFDHLYALHQDRTIISGITYHPGKPRVFDGEHDTLIFNRWRPSLTQLRPNTDRADVTPWLDLVTHVMGGAAEAERFVKWMAFVLQHPDRKPNWHPVLITKPGVGKDMSLRPMIFAAGVKNTAMIGVDEIASPFNEWLEKRLVIVNEVKQRNTGGKSAHDITNDIKKYLTAPPDTVTLNRKGLRPYEIANLTAWVFLSNELNPLYVGDDDRRYWIVDNRKADKLPSADYGRIDRWLKDNLLTVATFLLEYALTPADMSDIMSEAPMTQAKRDLMALNQNPVVSALEEIVADARAGIGPLAALVATNADLAQALTDKGVRASSMYTARYLREIEGCRPARPDAKNPHWAGVVKHKGSGHRLWVLGDTDHQGNDLSRLTAAELAELYETKKHDFPVATVLPFEQKSASNLLVV